MKKAVISILACLFTAGFLISQEPQTPKQEAPKATANVVAGLKLPAPQEVNYDEGFITLQAECKGPVKWLVLSTSVKIKFKVTAATNEIDIAVPPYESAITIFAIGLLDTKMTDFARTDVYVKGPPGPGPPPDPVPPDIKPPFHMTVIEDPAKRTDALRLIVDDPKFREVLKAKQVSMRVYTISAPEIKAKNFTPVLQRYGAPVLILQDSNGKGLVIGPVPPNQAELLKLIGPYVGGF